MIIQMIKALTEKIKMTRKLVVINERGLNASSALTEIEQITIKEATITIAVIFPTKMTTKKMIRIVISEMIDQRNLLNRLGEMNQRKGLTKKLSEWII